MTTFALMKFRYLFQSATFSLMIAGIASAAESRFAGVAADTPAWRDLGNFKKPSNAPGMTAAGWVFFGGAAPTPGLEFQNNSVRQERLPSFVKNITTPDSAQVAHLSNYADIENPDDSENPWGSGTLTMPAQAKTEIARFVLGGKIPDHFRMALLVDNLDAPVFTPLDIEVVIAGKEAGAVPATAVKGTANTKPDWYLWDIRGATDKSEVMIRVTPNQGLATLGGLVFYANGSAPKPKHIGQFSRKGEYVKDYYVFKDGDTFHLYYNVGDAGATQSWEEPHNEKAFGHATSKDLVNWHHHERILEVIPGSWEGQVVSAPSVLKHGDTYYMTYTGFDDRVVGKQAIGLATSKDLFKWERYKGNPVYEAPDWTKRNPSGWLDCRDAHIIRHGGEFLMFTMVTTNKGEGAISLASSDDMKAWEDLGPAVVTFNQPESPRVFEHKGTFYMFATSGHGKVLFKTKDPKAKHWEEVPFQWPAPGLWSGWEVVQDGERTIFSAFEWKLHGNFIRFWEVDWNDESPVVRY